MLPFFGVTSLLSFYPHYTSLYPFGNAGLINESITRSAQFPSENSEVFTENDENDKVLNYFDNLINMHFSYNENKLELLKSAISLYGLYTKYNLYGDAWMDTTEQNKQKRKSGTVEQLYHDEWEEVKRTKGEMKDQPYVVPDTGGIIHVRFSPDDAGKEIKIFKEVRDI